MHSDEDEEDEEDASGRLCFASVRQRHRLGKFPELSAAAHRHDNGVQQTVAQANGVHATVHAHRQRRSAEEGESV